MTIRFEVALEIAIRKNLHESLRDYNITMFCCHILFFVQIIIYLSLTHSLTYTDAVILRVPRRTPAADEGNPRFRLLTRRDVRAGRPHRTRAVFTPVEVLFTCRASHIERNSQQGFLYFFRSCYFPLSGLIVVTVVTAKTNLNKNYSKT